jgi:hypothetical protein
MTSAESDRSQPSYLELLLVHLVERSGITQPRAARRLNAIENQLANATVNWRELRPIRPSAEIRMAHATREAMFRWVEADQHADAETQQRLAAYFDFGIQDEGVPAGWIRILL